MTYKFLKIIDELNKVRAEIIDACFDVCALEKSIRGSSELGLHIVDVSRGIEKVNLELWDIIKNEQINDAVKDAVKESVHHTKQ